MPGTTWPVNGHPPGSSRDYPPAPVSMPANLFRHVNGYNARLPDPRLTREPGLLPHRSPRQSSANAAVGGLKPPPAGRLRRANNPSSPVQHHLKKLAYHTPFSVRDTRGSRLSDLNYACDSGRSVRRGRQVAVRGTTGQREAFETTRALARSDANAQGDQDCRHRYWRTIANFRSASAS
jgi:hypothetical protein